MVARLDDGASARHVFASVVMHQRFLGAHGANLRVQVGVVGPAGNPRKVLLVESVEENGREVERVQVEAIAPMQELDEVFSVEGGFKREQKLVQIDHGREVEVSDQGGAVQAVVQGGENALVAEFLLELVT